MASITTDKNGNRRIVFYDANKDRKHFRLGKLSKSAADLVKGHVEEIVRCQLSRDNPKRATSDWLGELGASMRDKLVRVGLLPDPIEEADAPIEVPASATLGPFVRNYIAKRAGDKSLDPATLADEELWKRWLAKAIGEIEAGTRKGAKPRTLTNYDQGRKALVACFGDAKPLHEITTADANDWRRGLMTGEGRKRGAGGYAPNTYNRLCGFARQFFAEAVDARLIDENPFGKMKGLRVRANKSRDYYLTPEETAKVLAAMPSKKWRLIFTLARFGGLRCPCEYKPLFWADVRWDENRIRIDSPKTGERFIPIFPELRPHLEAALAEAGDAAIDDPAGTPVIQHPRASSWNFATDLKRFIELAGVTPWTKPFQNLRLTRETELAATWPLHVVCEWIGNTEAVAKKHYLRATAADFADAAGDSKAERAASGGGHKIARGVDTIGRGVDTKAAPTSHESGCTEMHSEPAPTKSPEICAISADSECVQYTPQESNL